MSTALGIASVTHILKDLLNDGLINNDVASAIGTAINVTSLSPGQIEAAGTGNTSQLNIFMYRVTPNTGLSNLGYPSRNGRGDIVNNPPLALNLHYLLTAFGESELHSEILLGFGMQLLHENPVLARSAIRTSLTAASPSDPNGRLPANLLALATSELAEQIEQIKITNENINTEEMSRIWTAFQTSYRPCSAYQATVVLIESNKSTLNPLPVKERRFYTVPFKQPIIEKILSQVAVNEPILANQRIIVGHRLFIRGTQLKRDPMTILINGESFVPVADDISDTEVSLILPANLKAGILGVQVAHFIEMLSPPTDRKGAESNLLSFVLSPSISAPSVSGVVSDGTTVASADLEINVEPDVHKDQRTILLLNELNPPPGEDPKSYSFLLPLDSWLPNETQSGTITFPIADVKESDYLIRIQVDGAESPLAPLLGAYTDPHLMIQ